MKNRGANTLNPYVLFVLTFVLTCLILFIRVYFSSYFGGNKNTYIIFYPTVMLCALAGGAVAGLTATVILGIGSAFFLVPTPHSLYFEDALDVLGIVVFMLSGIFISYICEMLHRVRRRAQQQSSKYQLVSKQLQSAKDQLQAILDNVADGIVVRDRQGTTVYANQAALKLFRIPKDGTFLALDTIEDNFEITDEDGQSLAITELPVMKVFAGEKHAQEILCLTHKKTRREFWNIAHAKGIYTKNNSLQYIVVVFADITERRKLERQKDDFLGIASHELKTPVTSIKVYTQALQRVFAKQGNVLASEKLRKMDQQINKLSTLIEDLLDITKIQTGKMQFHKEYFNLHDLIGEIVEETQRTTKRHRITKRLKKIPDVYSDRNRIGQIIMNLLTNAIKYSANANEIIIATKQDGDIIIISVQDFGEGIPKHKQNKIFERYYREMGPKEITIPGLGLGLFISSQFIRCLGGKIWVESTVGHGATFSISIPVTKNYSKIKNSRGFHAGT